jgi:membrane-associated phospholipid phosphatase
MQGGHPDGLSNVLRSRVCKTGGSKKQRAASFDQSYDSVDEIQISPVADALLFKLRRWFTLYILATPVIWMYGYWSVKKFKQRKQRLVKEGTLFVSRLQLSLGCGTRPLMDNFFIFTSLLAEEEFYLLALPMLIWNIDYQYGRYMTMLVCGSLIVGNMLKDVFKLPRPSRQQVWIPPVLTSLDSTAARDFGFPSTHAMNALSNPLFTLLYMYYRPGESEGVTFPYYYTVAMGTLWFLSITVGRMCLGVHSPTDLRGGIILGVISAVFWHITCDVWDAWTRTASFVAVKVILLALLILVLNPQNRPLTPTFLQNVLLAGLMAGCTIGTQLHHSNSKVIDIETSVGMIGGLPDIGARVEAFPPIVAHTVRVIIGYTLVLSTRQLVKIVLVAFVQALGFQPNPQSAPNIDDAAELKRIRKQEAHILRGWDLFSAAFVKFGTYLTIAFLIMYVCPQAFRALNISAPATHMMR